MQCSTYRPYKKSCLINEVDVGTHEVWDLSGCSALGGVPTQCGECPNICRYCCSIWHTGPYHAQRFLHYRFHIPHEWNVQLFQRDICIWTWNLCPTRLSFYTSRCSRLLCESSTMPFFHTFHGFHVGYHHILRHDDHFKYGNKYSTWYPHPMGLLR